jgi:hypothetical protein
MRGTGIPNGLSALGYGEADVPGLVEVALEHERRLPAWSQRSASAKLGAPCGTTMNS